MKKSIVGIVVCIFFGAILFVYSDFEEPAAKTKDQLVYPEKEFALMKESIMDGLKDYEVVRDVVQDYLETMVTFTITTSISDSNADSKKLAKEIKGKVDQILKSKEFMAKYDYYFIAVTNKSGENLIDRPVDASLENQIKNFGEKQTNEVPMTYSKEEAIKNGDITFFKKRTPEQKMKIIQFENNVKNKKPDFIRFTQFTAKGDAVITEYQFNGKLIYYRYDSSRDHTDQHRKGTFIKGNFVKGSPVQDDYCKKLVSDSKMSYLTNCYKNDTIEF
ncbi:DUF4362 domain-containing protein [Peribacillus frigoritolerans]|uniref:DUF4362 domain-containing protein n=1 Tax=Peribacillus frigoritolerans TaxID=450367 RepID=UPI00207AD65B|nr:DUF4362 domain-containing protein [Peribacillus frigoritolerans]MEE3953482.1 DUF4362 domain-containing protein [Peribacillus frigoritolerans]USK63452.1 DUF4362 domain-containing protein [Peribacillus frigoritolerans]